jgi:hypothetical protein
MAQSKLPMETSGSMALMAILVNKGRNGGNRQPLTETVKL